MNRVAHKRRLKLAFHQKSKATVKPALVEETRGAGPLLIVSVLFYKKCYRTYTSSAIVEPMNGSSWRPNDGAGHANI